MAHTSGKFKSTGGIDLILLAENWTEETGRLSYSLKTAGYIFDTVVFQYDGFSHEGVTSPYEHYIYGGHIPKEKQPVYFDKLDIPEYFEIESSNTSGEIRDYDTLRGKIFYAQPRHERYVKVIDWMDGSGSVCCCDHYNCYGDRFAQTVFNADKKVVHKTYYTPDGREVLTENFLTGDIILTDSGRDMIFHSKTEFMLYYLREIYGHIDRIFYNSLSFPFFVANQYCQRVEKLDNNVLFWQEPIGADIPGNMKGILQQNLAGTQMIVIQHLDAYENLTRLSVDQSRFQNLGFIYPRLRENRYSRNALILTNSDQIEQLEFLAGQLSDVQFHIAALTEMSPKLLQMIKCANVHLYPTVTEKQLQTLWDSCDIYLDINHGAEILDGVETAFKHRELILGFNTTVHKTNLLSGRNVFSADDTGAAAMAEAIRKAVSDPRQMEQELEKQWRSANAETVDRYRQLI